MFEARRMRENLKERLKIMKKVILLFGLILFCAAFAAAQKQNDWQKFRNSLEEMLIAKEKQKWESLSNGRWSELKDMFAEDFVSIGYQPDGSVKMTNKAESFASSGALPAGSKSFSAISKSFRRIRKMPSLLIRHPDRSKFRRLRTGHGAAKTGRPFFIKRRCFDKRKFLNQNEVINENISDKQLSQKLERTEGRMSADLIESRKILFPEVGAEWIEVAGVYAMFDGAESPLTQTFGLGFV